MAIRPRREEKVAAWIQLFQRVATWCNGWAPLMMHKNWIKMVIYILYNNEIYIYIEMKYNEDLPTASWLHAPNILNLSESYRFESIFEEKITSCRSLMVCLACPGPCHIFDCGKGRTRSGVKVVSLCDTNAMAAMLRLRFQSNTLVYLFGGALLGGRMTWLPWLTTTFVFGYETLNPCTWWINNISFKCWCISFNRHHRTKQTAQTSVTMKSLAHQYIGSASDVLKFGNSPVGPSYLCYLVRIRIY